MRYVSTRGHTAPTGFADVLLAGLAPDGGLYVPEEWPSLSPDEIAAFAGQPYAAVATQVLGRFVGDAFSVDQLHTLAQEAYATFAHPAVAPLKQLDDRPFPARTVPRPDARLQGYRHAAACAAVRLGAGRDGDAS